MTADAPSPDVETVLAVIRAHRRNEVIEPDYGNDLPIRTRIKCDSDACDWYEVHDRWYEAVAAHEVHLAAALRGAGLPEPSGGVTVTEWGVRLATGEVQSQGSERYAALAAVHEVERIASNAASAPCPGWYRKAHPAVTVSRQRTTIDRVTEWQEATP